MRLRTLLYFLLALIAGPAFGQGARVTLSATSITDLSGAPLTGKLCLQPQNNAGSPQGFTFGGGGQGTSIEKCFPVTAGALSVQVPNTALTSPANLCLGGKAIDPSKPTFQQLVRTYQCLQPSSATDAFTLTWCSTVSGVTTCNLDNYIAPATPNAQVVSGPTGPRGPTGPTGPTGPSGGVMSGWSSSGSGPSQVDMAPGVVAVNKRVPNITKLLCEGDSITYGVATSGNTARYCNVAMTLPALAGRSIAYTNVATSGATIATMTSRYVASVKPSCLAGGTLLSIMIGTNDIGTSGHTDAAVFSELQTYVATAKADGCLVSVATVLPRTQTAWTATMEGYRTAYNTDIRNWAVPDFTPDFDAVIQNSADTSVFSDGLHPDDSAHALMADVLNASLMGTRQLKPVTYTPAQSATNLAINTDLDTIQACGTYDVNQPVNGPPLLGSGKWLHVLVICGSSAPALGPYTVQMAWQEYPAGVNNLSMRRLGNSAWTAWSQIYPAATAVLADSTDLNTITATGQYNGKVLTNAPTALGTGWVHLLVLGADGTSLTTAYTAQIASNVTGTANHIYFRSENASTWNAWTEIGGTASALSTTGSNGQVWGVASGAQGWITPSGLPNGSSGQVWSMTSGSTQGWSNPAGLPNTLGCLDGYDHLPCVVGKIAPATYSGTASTSTANLFTTLNDATMHQYKACGYVDLTVAATAGTFGLKAFWTTDSHSTSAGFTTPVGPGQWTTSASSTQVYLEQACITFAADANTLVQWTLVAGSVTGTPTVRYAFTVTLEQ